MEARRARANGHVLERMLLMRRDWQRRGGARPPVVFVWTPSHKGVFANQYADAVADAYIGDEPPMERHAQTADRGATLARCEV